MFFATYVIASLASAANTFAAQAIIQQPLVGQLTLNKSLLLSDDLLHFHKNLVNIQSISGNERAAGDWLASSLVNQGYAVEKQMVKENPERFNILAWPGQVRDTPIVLTSHIDVVPPFYPYKREKTTDGYLISGRGSVDDKGSIATQIIAANELIHSNRLHRDNVSLLFVVGEEAGAAGMRKANDLGIHPRAVIFGEPTEGKLVSGHKGALSVNITAKGKAAHSGYPWLGRSANEILVAALVPLIALGEHLPKSDNYGSTTMNIGRMEGGIAGNVVPQSAWARLAVRIAVGTPDDVADRITELVRQAVQDFLRDGLQFEDIIGLDFGNRGFAPVDLDHDVPGFESMPVNYGTDVPWLKKVSQDQKRYLYGPGSIFVAHSDHEALMEAELFEAVAGYQKIILHVMDTLAER